MTVILLYLEFSEIVIFYFFAYVSKDKRYLYLERCFLGFQKTYSYLLLKVDKNCRGLLIKK